MAQIFKKIEQKLTQAVDDIAEEFEKVPSFPDLLSLPDDDMLDIDVEFDVDLDIDPNISPPGRFKYPLGLAVNQEGNLVVTDYENHRIQILDWNGKFKKIIKCKLKSKVGHPKHWRSTKPMDVAVSDDGNYYITDQGNEQIIVANAKKITATFGREALFHPRGIALSKDGYILVTDWWDERYCVRKYTTGGKQVGVFGLPTAGERTTFEMPLFLVVNSKNQILVSNQGYHCIQVLDWNGKFLFTFANKESGSQAQVSGPTGIDVDSDDNVYVCDPNRKRVVKYNSNGKYLTEIDLSCAHERPYAIAVSKDRRKLAYTEFQGNHVRIIDM